MSAMFVKTATGNRLQKLEPVLKMNKQLSKISDYNMHFY